jgi:hypothetical protein
MVLFVKPEASNILVTQEIFWFGMQFKQDPVSSHLMHPRPGGFSHQFALMSAGAISYQVFRHADVNC